MQKRFVDVDGGSVECLDIEPRTAGAGELLLLHEGLGCLGMWRDFPAVLAAATGARVVAYSRLGFGRSTPRTTPFDPRFMHREAEETLPRLRSALGLANPILVGHSTGASMALLHAAADARVAAVVAIAPLIDVEPSNLESIAAAREHYESSDWRLKLARHHDDVDAVFRAWNDTWLDPRFRDWSIATDLAGIHCPVLAILGEDDQYSSRRQLDLIARHATRSAVSLLVLPRCGHAPHRDRAEEVVRAITSFVERATG